MNNIKRLSLFAPYALLALIGILYAANLPTQLVINRYLEALYTGSERGLLMNLYQVGTGINGIVVASLITALAYLVPVIDPAIMLKASTAHFGSNNGMLVYVAGLCIASLMLWLIGRSLYTVYCMIAKPAPSKQSNPLRKHSALFVPLGAIAIYGLYGWFGVIPLAFGLVKRNVQVAEK